MPLILKNIYLGILDYFKFQFDRNKVIHLPTQMPENKEPTHKNHKINNVATNLPLELAKWCQKR